MRIEPSEAMAENLKSRQGWAGRLLELAEHLESADRALIRSIYYRGMSAAEFARAARAHPRTVSHRLRRLVERMTSPTFLRIIDRRRAWPEQQRKVAEAIFLRGLSQRDTARRLDVSLHTVRRESDRIRAIIELGGTNASRT